MTILPLLKFFFWLLDELPKWFKVGHAGKKSILLALFWLVKGNRTGNVGTW